MKKLCIYTLTLLFAVNFSFGQIYEYRFNGNFNESTTGPAVSEVLSCGAAAGSYGSQIITTTAGPCGAAAQQTFDFNAGGGISFPNNNMIGNTYTIHVFFEFTSLGGYRRIMDFLGGSTDVGLYTLNNCLNFYPNGNVGICPYFLTGNFYLLTLVRDASNTITIYVNGASFGTYSDAAQNYVPSTTTTPIVFFRDNIASSAQCENSAGSIKYLALLPAAATAADVNTVWNNICALILPVSLNSFTAVKNNASVLLNWKTGSEINTSRYEIEKSTNGTDFTRIGEVSPGTFPANNYSFTDTKPADGDNYYRLRIVDLNNGFRNSSILKINFKGSGVLQVYPNPASGIVTISGITDRGELRLFNANGSLLKTFVATGNAMNLGLDRYPAGVYIIEYQNGGKTERQKLMKY